MGGRGRDEKGRNEERERRENEWADREGDGGSRRAKRKGNNGKEDQAIYKGKE